MSVSSFLPGDVVHVKDRIISIVLYRAPEDLDRPRNYGLIIKAQPFRGDALVVIAVAFNGALCATVHGDIIGWFGNEVVVGAFR